MTQEVANVTWPRRTAWPVAYVRPALIVLATLAVTFSLARGLRFPSFWATSAAQVDCSTGFVKRCALGEIARLAHYPVSNYWALTALFAASLVCALGALVWWCGPMGRSTPGKLIALAFACSFTAAYYMGLIGYFDIPLTILTVAATWCAHRRRLWWLAGLTVAGLMIHEVYLLTFFPVTVLPLLLADRPRWKPIFGIGAVALALTALLALQRPASAAFALHLYEKARDTTDFPIRDDYFFVLRWSLSDNLRLMRLLAYPEAYWRDMIVWGAVMISPVMALAGWAFFAGWRLDRWRRVLVVGAVLAPLSMNLLGLDASRWYTLVAVNALIVIGLMFRAHGPPKLSAKPLLIAALAASAIGLCTQIRFIDDMPPTLIDAMDFRLPIYEPAMSKKDARALYRRSRAIDRVVNGEVI
jgi:hypothetical protein